MQAILLDMGLIDEGVDCKLFAKMTFYEPDRRARDTDNFNKAPWDALTKAGFWTDDKLVRKYTVEFIGRDDHDFKGGKVNIKIRKL